MPKRVTTGAQIISEVRRRIAAAGPVRPAGDYLLHLVPADADNNGGCNWTTGEDLAGLPEEVQAAVRQVMHLFDLELPPPSSPPPPPAIVPRDSLLERKLRADLAFLEWKKTESLWHLAVENPSPGSPRAVALREILIRRMRHQSATFIQECQVRVR